jgi:hypothetical protein
MAWLHQRCTPALWALLLLCACDEGDPGEPDASDERDASSNDAGARSDAGAEDAAKDGGPAPEDSGPVETPCEVTPPTGCPNPPVYYEDITPILKERCLGCHDGKGEEWPLTSYGHAAGWTNEIRAAMNSCDMPPKDAGIVMPAEEREKILTWIVCKLPQRGDAGAGGH